MLRIALTPGEPAGVGPELVIQLAQQPQLAELVVIADADILGVLFGQHRKVFAIDNTLANSAELLLRLTIGANR